jgi:hypothetical protein
VHFKKTDVSYEIYFIKKKHLNTENIYPILETTEPKKTDEIYISKDLMWKLKSILEEKGLKFEVFESKTDEIIELNFPSYQVSMYNSQIAISLPYWDSNSVNNISNEIKIISNVLLENGFTGFDPQTEQFVIEKYEFQKAFTMTKEVVDEHFKKTQNNNLNENNTIKYVGIGLGILIFLIIIWKVLRK